MLAAVVIIVVLLAIPVVVIISGGIASAVLGWFLRVDAEQRHEGSELLDLNT